jgi:GT2 family glycosyltransferase
VAGGDSWPAARPPAVSIVVVTYESAAVLPGCLDSIVDGCEGVRLGEVVVADNDSLDESVKIAETYIGRPIRAVQLGRNAGYAAAVNAGIDSMSLDDVDAVLVLNPDIRLGPGSVRRLVDDLRRSGVGIVVPRLVNPDGSLQPSLRRTPTVLRALGEALIGGSRAGRTVRLGELITDPVGYDTAGPAAWATGAAMLIAREALQRSGRWDESLLLYGEEVEFALRAADRGWSLWYEPAAVAEHIGGESDVNPFLYSLMTVNRVRVYRMRRGRLATIPYYLAVTFGELVRAAAGRRTARAAVVALLVPSRRPTELPQHG